MELKNWVSCTTGHKSGRKIYIVPLHSSCLKYLVVLLTTLLHSFLGFSWLLPILQEKQKCEKRFLCTDRILWIYSYDISSPPLLLPYSIWFSPFSPPPISLSLFVSILIYIKRGWQRHWDYCERIVNVVCWVNYYYFFPSLGLVTCTLSLFWSFLTLLSLDAFSFESFFFVGLLSSIS